MKREMTNAILSVNVGQPQAIEVSMPDGATEVVVTGIFKSPVEGPVEVRWWGLEGDGQADTRVFKGQQVHGGARKAVYVYSAGHYPTWVRELGRDLAYGQFGENLTVEGFLENDVRIGDVLRAGTALLQVTEPRGPCYKLDIRMGAPEFKKLMRNTGRTGFYVSVLEQGILAQGDALTLVESDPSAPTVLAAFRRE